MKSSGDVEIDLAARLLVSDDPQDHDAARAIHAKRLRRKEADDRNAPSSGGRKMCRAWEVVLFSGWLAFIGAVIAALLCKHLLETDRMFRSMIVAALLLVSVTDFYFYKEG